MFYTCGLHYKHIMIVNDDSSIINKFEASLSDDDRVVIYDCHMFIVQTTDLSIFYKLIFLMIPCL